MKRKERPSHFLLDLSDVAVDQCLEWLDIKSAIIIKNNVLCAKKHIIKRHDDIMQFDAQRVSKCF